MVPELQKLKNSAEENSRAPESYYFEKANESVTAIGVEPATPTPTATLILKIYFILLNNSLTNSIKSKSSPIKLSELKIIKEQAEGKLPSADNDKQKQQLQLEIKIPGNLLEYVQMYYDDVINNSIEHKLMDETIDKVAKT
ncbi:unnamed protein product [Adineta steineri]|uniref:Uncharacterized protein n=1 Tax=Adineta steineri TaxID=433720 RepID=A0A814V5X5_9BILA|nr:unnamed protein product [Adineta steineri]